MKKKLEEEYVTLLIDMQKLIENILKIMIKTKNYQILEYWHVNNLYGWAVSQNLPVKNFKWVEDISEFDKSFIKSYNEESNEAYFL